MIVDGRTSERIASVCVSCFVIANILLLPVGSAQEYTRQEQHDVYPQNMWTYDRPVGHHYSKDAVIRELLHSDREDRMWLRDIVIRATSLGHYLELFRQRGVVRLQVVGATNADIQSLSELDSLEHLSLPCCKADDFRPLKKLPKLRSMELANPNLNQFEEDRLLSAMKQLATLTLYNVRDLQQALELPGLEARSSLRTNDGLFTLIIQAPKWNPRSSLKWPRRLEGLPEACILADRIRFSYLQQQRAEIIVGRYGGDDPAICSARLTDVIDNSGFYDNRQVVSVDLRCCYVSRDDWQLRRTYDRTNIAPLRAFRDLKYLTLEGSFYDYESLKDVSLEWVYFTECSPFPSEQAVAILSKHPTLKRVTKNIYSATDKVLFERN